MNNLLIKDVPIDALEGKTILLTGATGLVGTHFLKAFKEMYDKGVRFNVIAIGRNYPMEYLSDVINEPWVTYSMMDLSSANIQHYFKNVDVVIHAATYGQPRKFLSKAEATVKLNTSTTIELLKKVQKGKFLFISSSEVYSGLTNTPFVEGEIGTTTPSHPRAIYIEAKRCGEAIINNYRNTGWDARIVRLSLGYGEGVRRDDDRVMNVFIRKALLEGEIKLIDTGSAERTYCYIGDSVNMMLRVLLEGKESLYNIGGYSYITIANLAYLIGEILNVPVIIPNGSIAPDGAPMSVRLCMDRYELEFGKREYVYILEGVMKTIDYYKKLLS